MARSKSAHLAELTRQQEARQQGRLVHALAAAAHLDGLLAQHDRCVRAFTAAVRTLASADADAHRALLACLAARNASIGQVEH